MEIKVFGTVNVELGPQTLALLTGGMAAPAATPVKAVEAPKAEVKEDVKPKPQAAAPAAKPKAEKASFEDLDDETKLAEIQALVTKATKKGKSADVKFLLSNFEATRASNLAPEQYDDFYGVMQRYHAGEAVTDIFPSEDENLD